MFLMYLINRTAIHICIIDKYIHVHIMLHKYHRDIFNDEVHYQRPLEKTFPGMS